MLVPGKYWLDLRKRVRTMKIKGGGGVSKKANGRADKMKKIHNGVVEDR